MGTFNFNTTDTWQIAWHHGHSAFRLLRIVYEIETEYVSNFNTLMTLEYGGLEYLKVLDRNHYLTIDMFRISSASIMMFQAMMEALINDSLESEPLLANIKAYIKKNKRDGGFKSKWEKSLIELKQDTGTFLIYHDSIYKKYRNPLVHPRDISVKFLDEISFLGLLTGYQNGWDAYSKMYDGLSHLHSPDSWKIMCDTYNLPVTIL